jgi:hypothetical protein
MATTSQAAVAPNVATTAEQRMRVRSWQTRKLYTASAMVPRIIERASVET